MNSDMKQSVILLPLAMSLLSACTSDLNPVMPDGHTLVHKEFIATTDLSGTRTSFSANAQNNNAVVWNTDDSISVLCYYDDDSKNSRFNLTSGNGTTVGTFTGDVISGPETYLALSPYQSGASVWNFPAIDDIELPSIQHAVAGSADPAAMLMVAQNSSTDEFQFKNVCSYIKFTPTFDCEAITVQSKDNHMMTGVLTYDVGSLSGTLNSNVSSSSVTLTGNMQAGQTYYAAVMPGVYASGLSVSILAGGKVRTMGSTNSQTLSRSQYHDFSSTIATQPANDMFVDLGLTSGTKWAACNLGAVAPQYYGNLMTWNPSLVADVWGTGSSLPTQAQFDELVSQCSWEYVENYNSTGVPGYVVTGTNSKSIFFPLTGYVNDSGNRVSANSTAYYWTKTDNGTKAKGCSMSSTPSKVVAEIAKTLGGAVRLVK